MNDLARRFPQNPLLRPADVLPHSKHNSQREHALTASMWAVILEGLAWIEAEARRRFDQEFAALAVAQHHAICDDIAWPPDAKPEFRKAAEFFNRFRNIAAGAYYGTPEGWKAIGYIGNTPMPTFAGPPKEVLDRLGLVQSVP